MFTTTLRLDDDLGRFLREAADAQDMSVNGWVADLLRREQAAAARRRLAADWAAYGKDEAAQDVDYAFSAQADVAAEPPHRTYRARKSK
ncbi:toxin-antitoxin system HicB family antitoxin [Geothrix sp. 21YS21S-4]|uniref:toxin-antitoxin system HicB family antitoxin n=1 Tax=Geothrix sp. 21YS21S-4 TaxID=3068889 RepID=UPI0027B96E1D|nr:toxin-antitoxin system HicB family antitoxin [Geothrix sp. 21YS21S-4]